MYKNEHGAHGEKILKEFHKSRTIKNKITNKSPSSLENKSISAITEIINLDADNIIEKSIIKSDKKNSINFNININNTRTNEILNIIKFINNLYTSDNHFQKELPIKSLSIKNLPKIDNNSINNSAIKNISIKNRLKNLRKKTFKSLKEIQPHNEYNKDEKTNFINYLKLDEQKYKNEKNIGLSEGKRDITFNNRYNFSNSLRSYQSIFNKSKKSKKEKSKSKFNVDKKSTLKKSIKNTIQSIETGKQNNKDNPIKLKKETTTIKSNNKEDKKEETKINNNKNDKNQRKFNFCNIFYCLNS